MATIDQYIRSWLNLSIKLDELAVLFEFNKEARQFYKGMSVAYKSCAEELENITRTGRKDGE